MTAKRNRRERKATPRRGRKLGIILLVMVLGPVAIHAFVFDDMALWRYLAMREQLRGLETSIGELKRSNAAVREEIDRVLDDPARIEELAREQLGLVREGETVYQIVGDPDWRKASSSH